MCASGIGAETPTSEATITPLLCLLSQSNIVANKDVSDDNSEMDAIHFQTEVGSDNTIRVPEGVRLPPGLLEVTVVPSVKPADVSDDLAATRAWLLDVAAEAESDPTPLPVDLAENHDHYAHGKPRE